MPKLIFDIETIGVEFSTLDHTAQKLLLATAENEEEERLIKEELGFSPLTGRIVAIGVLNPQTDKGAAYYQIQDKNDEKKEEGNAVYFPCKDEKEILKKFWEAATHYDQFISFNGHSFDVPYLIIRSAALKVKPTVNLMHNRYAMGPHLDIYDRLTNFGALRGKRSIHLWCQAFGIESPKAQGVSGLDVARLFKENRCADIARYCFGDLKATKDLHNYWERYFK